MNKSRMLDVKSIKEGPLFVTLLRAEYGQILAKGVRLLGKSMGAMVSLRQQGGFVSPKVNVQAWLLSNTTVQENLL